jgi:hypothetical protein
MTDKQTQISDSDNGRLKSRTIGIRSRIAKWCRGIGYCAIILAVFSTIYHVLTERNIYYLAARPTSKLCFVCSYTLAIASWKLAFVTVSIGLGIPAVTRLSTFLAITSDNSSDDSPSRKRMSRHLSWIPIAIGIALLYVNTVGYVYGEYARHVWGWPFIHSACCLDPYGGRMFLEFFFSFVWLTVDVLVMPIIMTCATISVKYLMNRQLPFKQISLEEILILMTATAWLMPFLVNEYQICRSSLTEFPFDISHCCIYFPASFLSLDLSIPVLFGVGCAAMVLGFVSVRFTVSSIKRLFSIFCNRA